MDFLSHAWPGFAFTGYRSFSGDLQTVGPLAKVNVIAGQNNSGKSNILRFAREILGKTRFEGSSVVLPKISGLDIPLGNTGNEQIVLALPVSQDLYPESSSAVINGAVERLFKGGAFKLPNASGDWLTIERGDVSEALIDRCIPIMNNFNVDQLFWELGGGAQGIQPTILKLVRVLLGELRLPPFASVSAGRRVEPRSGDYIGARVMDPDNAWIDGAGIIDRLSELQNPDVTTWSESRAKFAKINQFVQTVLGSDEFSINIPHARDTIQIQRRDQVLPLENVGTGIHQVVILAAAATLLENTIICMEEPETHLHPVLQRKLIRYLMHQTTNQYLIATHSAHLLDYEAARVLHVEMGSDRTSRVAAVRRPNEMIRLCGDLGYRSSDLLQANFVIWVEGPSDRDYLRRWLGLFDPALSEGVHFSIMFYGGALLNHLSFDDTALTEFIHMRHLNQNAAIIIDSDKKLPGDEINSTKQRIQSEFETGGQGMAWVTAGYTIENYVPYNKLRSAVQAVHPSRTIRQVGGQFTNPLVTNSKEPKFDKIAIARKACALLTEKDLDQLDLNTQLQRLVPLIWEANELEAPPPES